MSLALLEGVKISAYNIKIFRWPGLRVSSTPFKEAFDGRSSSSVFARKSCLNVFSCASKSSLQKSSPKKLQKRFSLSSEFSPEKALKSCSKFE